MVKSGKMFCSIPFFSILMTINLELLLICITSQEILFIGQYVYVETNRTRHVVLNVQLQLAIVHVQQVVW